MGALPPPVSDISIAANGITPPSFWLTVGLHLRKAAKNRARQSRRARPVFQKPRSLSPPQRRKKVRSFSSATCAAKKILLRLQVWNLCAGGAQIMRAADCNPFVKKEYFLTALRYALLLEKRSLPSAAVRMPQTMTMSAQMIVVGVSTLVSPRNTAVKKIAQAA